jgi:hypothetical protein
MIARASIALMGSLLVALFALFASNAGAAEKRAEDLPFRLVYEVPASCPASDVLVRKIRSSSARARPGTPVESAVDLWVTIGEHTEGFVGELRVRYPDGSQFTRTVPAPDCDESTSAIALIAAIAIDPDAALQATTEPGEPPPALAPPAPPAPPALPPPSSPINSGVEAPSAGSSVRPSGWSLGARGGVTSALAPSIVPDFGLFGAYDAGGSSFVSPRASVTALYARSATAEDRLGSARYDRIGGRLAGCPVDLLGVAGWALRPCGVGEAGRLHAQGTDVPNAQSRSVVWVALGASVRADTELVPRLTFGAELGVLFPLVRNGFFYEPDGVVVHRVGATSVQGAIELGFRL